MVALVITIIVLLILAGITISLIIGENGLLKRAEEGKKAHEKGMANDINEMNKATEYMNNFFGGTKEDKTLVEMYDKAVEDNCTNEDGTCTNENHLHIGDYVDYENPKTGKVEVSKENTDLEEEDQVFEVANNQLNWRVLGKDKETGGIKLISGRPIKSNKEKDPYLYLRGARSYLNGETILNNIGKMYENKYAEKGRSVNQKDIDEITGITTVEKINEVNILPDKWNKAYGEEYSVSDHYTPESYLNGQTTTVEGKVSGYAYYINASENPTVRVENKRIYNMLFDNVEYRRGATYWLASQSVCASEEVEFCLSAVEKLREEVEVGSKLIFISYAENIGGGGLGVRPVIILKSNVQKSEVPKIADKTEEEWNYNL